MSDEPLHLFDGFGVELEYMIVDAESLDVRPLCDQLLELAAGERTGDYENGAIAWSNELVLHVVELKTNGPTRELAAAAAPFQRDVGAIDALLEPLGARLMPGAMHPWMDPEREMRLWPWDNGPVYATFDRIFDCRGHGWANLQSAHLNLPFQGDEEFARLHAAIRAVLPLLPALSASSPVMDGKPTGLLDSRLRVYRGNARRVPSVAGAVIPEPIWSRADYEGVLLEGIHRDLAPLDPEGILRHEWVNSRGAIARFDRMAIEIRVLDVQERPLADLAIAALISDVLRVLTDGAATDLERLRCLDTGRLATSLWRVVEDAGEALVEDPELLACLGVPARRGLTAREVWSELLARTWPAGSARRDDFAAPIEVIQSEGTLSRRLLRALGPEPDRARLQAVWGELCECLARGEAFHA